ncbi:NAD(P)H-hydrate epimerase [Helicobacter sp. 16-1353]|uniref:NAD(P)H-hydrate epimerase n=1 Tax=Helicobacter sp. 16-1353 TaxID=2004996 RepID=UPI000DCEF214|nr:NAD(P)H-hydrate epimerase [Helicobacter sp. 16-1353]RAX52691.1 NAD(P)H-hydrate epimerase [Helicobacter sp. 16-1353]
MKNVYSNIGILDENAINQFDLSNEILIENAANGLEKAIDRYAIENSMIIIVVGTGNNGADGLTLARRLIGKYNIKIYMPNEPKSELSKKELERLKKLNAVFIDKLFCCDIVVDCLFGSGFRGSLDDEKKEIIATMNKIARINIACDIPSGISSNGEIDSIAFDADVTISMGALKLAYFSDRAKDYIGEIIEVNLGISKEKYEQDSIYKLLTKDDLKLPKRLIQNSHKGNFGHCCVIAGEKEGACILSALSAFAFGSGLVSIIGDVKNIPYHIMNTHSLPKNCNAIAFGMGLGNRIDKYNFDFLGKIPSVIDADMFYNTDLKDILDKGNIVLTPHLKEFSSLLKLLGLGEFNSEYIAKNRIDLALKFSDKYPHIVLVVKGANSIIAYDGKIYINTLGLSNLSKGGSGDILSGMIASLLSQDYSLLDASISASLAHSIASQNIKTSYGLEPLDLVEEIKKL